MQKIANLKKMPAIVLLAHVSIVSAFASTSKGMEALRQGDCVEAIKMLEPAAKRGDVKVQKTLGDLYAKADDLCDDVRTDSARAVQWYLRAATLGEKSAPHVLATFYLDGRRDLPKDKARAIAWLRKSVQSGNRDDAERLGRLYEEGDGTPADRVLAHMLRIIAAMKDPASPADAAKKRIDIRPERLSPDQQKEAEELAAKWKTGDVLPNTSKTGRNLPSLWYHKAADKGDVDAMFRIGQIYRYNEEGNQDVHLGRKYLRQAAEQGHAEAMKYLSHMYFSGDGVPADYVLGYVCATLAEAGKDSSADAGSKRRWTWDETLTTEQLIEGKEIALRWKKGTPLPTATQTGLLRKKNRAEKAHGKQEATAEVLQLFVAASEGDEVTFNRLLGVIPNFNDYVLNGKTLLQTIVSPAKSLIESEMQWLRANQEELTHAHMQAQRAVHAAMLPAKARMLAAALQRGTGFKEGTPDDHASPLHLSTVFGSAEMVRILLQHGADPNQFGGQNYMDPPIQFSLKLKEYGRILPELVTPEERTHIILELLRAGAKRPYLDDDARKEKENQNPPDRPTADYRLWGSAVTLTSGAEVLSALEQTGTTPYFGSNDRSLIGEAAEAGNLGAVTWLKRRAPRYGRRHRDKVDHWLDAAMRAMHGKVEAVDPVLNELIVQDMRWDQSGPNSEHSSHDYLPLHLRRKFQLPWTTLLGHAVLAHRYEWVDRLVKMGVPVDLVDSSGKTPLALAVADGDLNMVERLLSLGANPNAGRDTSALVEALRREKTNIEILTALLETIKQSPSLMAQASKWSPLQLVFEQARKGTPDGERIRKLVEYGFSPRSLAVREIAQVMRAKDTGLFGYLMEHGMLQPEEGSRLPETYSFLLSSALASRRDDLIPRLLALGLNPSFRLYDDRYSAMEYAIYLGNEFAVDRFLASGAQIDASQTGWWGSILDLAVASNNPAMLKRISNDFTTSLENACLPSEDSRMLVDTVLEASDAGWSTLIRHGFGSNPDACPFMLDRLIQGLASRPDLPQIGWLGAQLAQRIKDLVPPNAKPETMVPSKTAASLSEEARSDLLQVLRAAGWRPAQVLQQAQTRNTPATRKPADIALQKKLVGHYYLEDVREVGSEIILRKDGRFSYFLAYGATDEFAQGTWQVVEGAVVFQSDPPSKKDQFRLREIAASKDAQVSVKVGNGKQIFPGIKVMLLGDRGIKSMGTTTESGAMFTFPGPVRQVVLYHPGANNGRAYVYEVPARDGLADVRNFAFEVRAPRSTSQEFDVKMEVRNGRLGWRRGNRELLYTRH